ncbi:hypothetical protein A2U01_0090720, partial [Trifolium medium]|nr:hypothetical protein [Trifolium medium]
FTVTGGAAVGNAELPRSEMQSRSVRSCRAPAARDAEARRMMKQKRDTTQSHSARQQDDR